MPTFEVYGTIKMEVSKDIEANTEKEAIMIFKRELLDYHRLDTDCTNVNKTEIDLDAVEYDED